MSLTLLRTSIAAIPRNYDPLLYLVNTNPAPIHNPKTLLRLEDLNFGEARANPNEP